MTEETTLNNPAATAPEPQKAELFYEDQPVKGTAETQDGRTVGILFEDGRSINVPKWDADLLLKPAPIAHGDAVNLRANFVAGKTLDLWLDLNIKFCEMDAYYKKISWSYFDKYGGSVETALNKAVSFFTGGLVENQDQLRTGHVDAILRAEPEVGEKPLTPPAEGGTVQPSA